MRKNDNANVRKSDKKDYKALLRPTKKENIVNFDNFENLKISLASPEEIIEWSTRKDDPTGGEVTKSETINFKSHKPEKDGLFSEVIFGPERDYECSCGKYKKIKYSGIVCEKCNVKVTRSAVRREWMGHIKLATPIAHVWYYKGVPSKIATIMETTPKKLENLINYSAYLITTPGIKDEEIIEYHLLDEHGNEVVNSNKFPEYDAVLDQTLNGKRDDYSVFKTVHKINTGEIVSENFYNDFKFQFIEKHIEVETGAEAVQNTLKKIDLEKEKKKLIKEIEKVKGASTTKEKYGKKLELINAFINGNTRPEWMVLNVLPVLPPELRPILHLDGGRFAPADLNELYRKVINRNNRLKTLIDEDAPEIILKNEKRLLQSAVDSLIDNGRNGKAVLNNSNRPYKSLSELLKGKTGRFRQNLLGKRQDYSARSVIVVGPELKFYQCGLPKEIALELFKPFIIHDLESKGLADSYPDAKLKFESKEAEVYDVLDEVVKNKTVLLNRAPTLHRLGIQAFEPVIIEGQAIKLHPLVCTAFNADFDGDQMAVHLPLGIEAQTEARYLMLSVNNILAPKDGSPITVPTQDMILGCYHLTRDTNMRIKATKDEIDDLEKLGIDAAKYLVGNDDEETVEVSLDSIKKYYNYDDFLRSYNLGKINISDLVMVKVFSDEKDEEGNVIKKDTKGKIILSTVGRFIFNSHIPQDLGFVDRNKDKYSLEIDFRCGKKEITKIVDTCYKKHGNTITSEVLDTLKDNGFLYSTLSAVSVGIDDMKVTANKKEIVEKAEEDLEKAEQDIIEKIEEGEIAATNRENELDRVRKHVWNDASDKVVDSLTELLDKPENRENSIKIMADSGARGSYGQIKQIGGMRGLMTKTATFDYLDKRNIGKKTFIGRGGIGIFERPIKSNFREGLNVLEFYISCHGARKSLIDTATGTADSGYLTRRLVDVSHSVIITEDDCKTKEYITVSDIYDEEHKGIIIEHLEERIKGRTLAEDLEIKGKKYEKNSIISDEDAKIIANSDEILNKETGKKEVKIRSVLACNAKNGVCSTCYGKNLGTNKKAIIGDAVGVIAAQSIGEPGTQLTMRTFHTGGVASEKDITQGLPRVEELFECRNPNGAAIISDVEGIVREIKEEERYKKVIIETNAKVKKKARIKDLHELNENDALYEVPKNVMILVKKGDQIKKGDAITEGPIYPQDLMEYKGKDAVVDYLTKEIQKTYRQQGVDINDRHIEVILSQMLSKSRVKEQNDTTLIEGEVYSKQMIKEENDKALEAGKKPAKAEPALVRITTAARDSDSFLSGASFQETTRVLTDAAIKSKKDYLIGLKENVIAGRLIPAGTGANKYKNFDVDYKKNTNLIKKVLEEKEEELRLERLLREEKRKEFKPEIDAIINGALSGKSTDEPVLETEGLIPDGEDIDFDEMAKDALADSMKENELAQKAIEDNEEKNKIYKDTKTVEEVVSKVTKKNKDK